MLGSIVNAVGSGYMAMVQANANNVAYRKNSAALNSYEQKTQNWLDKMRNADITQLPGYSAAATTAEDLFKRSNKAAAGRQSVMGGSTASVAAEKEVNNRARGELIRTMASDASKYKQSLDATQNRFDADVLNRRNGLSAQQLAGRTEATRFANRAWGQAGKALDDSEGAIFEHFNAKNNKED